MLDRTRFDRSAGRMTRGTMVRGVTALFGAGLDIAAGGGPSSAVMPDPVNIALNHDAFNLPIFVAIDKGISRSRTSTSASKRSAVRRSRNSLRWLADRSTSHRSGSAPGSSISTN
jgi:hypothetical protein